MSEHPSGDLTCTWGEWLSTWPWDWWATLTFRDEYSPNAADRAFLRWARWLRTDSPSLGYFVGHELGRIGGRLHLHALIGGLQPQVYRTAAWKRWHDRHGRAEILPYDPDRGASHYISKYVAKDFARYGIEEPSAPRPTLLTEGGMDA